jgi:hypothetical protein
MAKVKFSALISEMRNKLNGSVFSKNRSGNYLRNKVTPVNPQTSAQTARRSVLTYLSQNWPALTQSQRDSWNNAVMNFQTTDIFGDLKTPSGINLYQRLNGNLASAGQSYLTTPPAPSTLPANDFNSLAADSATGDIDMGFVSGSVPAGTTIVIEATGNMSPGRNFAKSEYAQIGTIAATTALPFNAGSLWSAKYGTLVAGQKVFFRAFFVDNTTGLKTQSVALSAIIA